MAKINVKLQAFYGFSCGECSHGSEETLEVEVNEKEFEALQKLGPEEISCEAVVESIENGETELQSLHDRLEEEFYYMVEEYWLYEADNDCLEESLIDALENDMEEEAYVPSMALEDFVEGAKNGEIDFEGLQFGYFDDLDEDFDYEEEEEYLESTYKSYILNEYYDWVCGHDHEFIAERVGLDLDACRDEEVNYTITLSLLN